jgi:HD-GYP domain-containing protein (c-di-GMP phosphodiesterase class II)
VTPTSRLAEVLAALSLATDLGIGASPETSLRTCALAALLGRRMELGGVALRTTYYAGLMRHLGCTAWSYEAALLVGDDHDLIQTFEAVDSAQLTHVARGSLGLARGGSLGRRVRAVARVLTHPSTGAQLSAAQCEQAEALARDLGLGDDVCTALAQIYERHDGRGQPHGLRGTEITAPARLVHIAQVIEALHRKTGREAVLDELRQRRGRQFAPDVCDAALEDEAGLWAALESPRMWEDVLAAEPTPHVALAPERLQATALAFGRFADLKSPYTLGHAPSVANLAAAAALQAGWPAEEVERLRLAALLHDLGSVSVGNQIWDHAGPLGAAAWEQVRLHAYYSERILSRAPATASLAAIAGAHHERLDGTGYHRGARAEGLELSARVLAAADAYVAMGEARPHRPALDAEARAAALGSEASAGRLCRQAVAMVLAASGQKPPRVVFPAGLTAREAEVFGLVARGLATKEIASVLDIAVRTVKHHIQHAYQKTGVSSRAGAALFAARHDLLPQTPDRPKGP